MDADRIICVKMQPCHHVFFQLAGMPCPPRNFSATKLVRDGKVETGASVLASGLDDRERQHLQTLDQDITTRKCSEVGMPAIRRSDVLACGSVSANGQFPRSFRTVKLDFWGTKPVKRHRTKPVRARMTSNTIAHNHTHT